MKETMRVMVLFIYIYIQLIDTNHDRLQSYLTLCAVYKSLNTTKYYISTKLFFLI